MVVLMESKPLSGTESRLGHRGLGCCSLACALPIVPGGWLGETTSLCEGFSNADVVM